MTTSFNIRKTYECISGEVEENYMENSDFWSALDNLIASSEVVIDRPSGSKHPRYDITYAVDYGYLANTNAMDGGGIDVWRGTDIEQKCDAIICTIDLLKKDSEIKILLGCNEDEKEKIMRFQSRAVKVFCPIS